MDSTLIKRFSVSAGLLLVGMAMLHILGNQGAIVLQPADPIFGVSTRYIFWGLGGLEFLIAGICLFTRQTGFQIVCVFWLTSNLLVYRLFLFYFGVKVMSAYCDTMAYNFGISDCAMNLLWTLAMIFLWLGSGLSLFFSRKGSKQPAIPQSETNIVQA